VKICKASQPTSCPRTTAFSIPPLIDIWAPKRMHPPFRKVPLLPCAVANPVSHWLEWLIAQAGGHAVKPNGERLLSILFTRYSPANSMWCHSVGNGGGLGVSLGLGDDAMWHGFTAVM
jgi:hypothetical protein